VLEEEAAWDRAVADIAGSDAKLIGVSRYVGDSRVYARDGQVAKIRSRRAVLQTGVLTLANEAKLLTLLGVDVRTGSVDDWDYLTMPRLTGPTLDRVVPRMSVVQRVRVLPGVMRDLRRIHHAGVAHRDLRPDNIVLDPDGRAHLIDFDRAISASGPAVALADWVGLSRDGFAANPYWKFALFFLAPKVQSMARRLRALSTRQPDTIGPSGQDGDLAMLAGAWQMAANSPANSPGHRVAYYALTFKHQHFPGERPWYLRWEAIRRGVDFRGKRFIELGCNMGLLASFARIHGAASSLGVDRDPTIIRSARLVSDALGAQAQFEAIDLVSDPNWPQRLGAGDIVAAMSLVHWLPNPEPILRYLGQHAEVIYEGHDSLEVETARLKSVGFTQIRVLGETERGRPLLHGFRARAGRA